MTPNMYRLMKLYRYAFFALVTTVLGACSADIEDNDATFAITRVQSDRAWVEINPTKSNHYVFGAVPEKEFNASHTDRKFIDRNFAEVKELYDTICASYTEQGQQAPAIEEVMFYSGAVADVLYMLEPNTDYIGFLYYLNKKNKPQNKLLKRAFHTPSKPVSDITFQVHADSTKDDTYYVVPSNDDTYLYEEVSFSEVLHYFLLDTLVIPEYSAAYAYYVGMMETYYKNDFSISSFTISGNDTTSLLDSYKNLREGDRFYLVCVGYTTEESTAPSFYRIEYHKGKPLTITPLPKDTSPEYGVSPRTIGNVQYTMKKALSML